MKRFLSLILALAMSLAVGFSALAAEGDEEHVYWLSYTPYIIKDGKMERYHEDEDNVAYGEALYYKIRSVKSNGEKLPFSRFKDEFKLSSEWEVGEELVKEVSLVPFKGRRGRTADFCIKIGIEERPFETEERDIVGKFTVKSKKGITFDSMDSDEAQKDCVFYVAFTVVPSVPKEGQENLITDEAKLYKFSDSEEESLTLFGNMGRFDINTVGQDDLILSSSVSYNEGIEAIAPDMVYSYFTGNGACFNKIGTLYLNATYGDHLYKVEEDGTLKALEGNYDTDEEAFKIRTRHLGSYVISEKELDLETINPLLRKDF